jgi:hypothetical protein
VDLDFLKSAFNKLLLNFTWWVNRKDRFGKNVFEGGFLGLDNIGVFDRSAPLPTGGHLEQADGTAWMALFSQNMTELAVELAVHDPTYQWRDYILFYEYFHGDNGAGLGASHQTGWTGVVAKLIQIFGLLDPQKALGVGKGAAFIHGESEGEVKK